MHAWAVHPIGRNLSSPLQQVQIVGHSCLEWISMMSKANSVLLMLVITSIVQFESNAQLGMAL